MHATYTYRATSCSSCNYTHTCIHACIHVPILYGILYNHLNFLDIKFTPLHRLFFSAVERRWQLLNSISCGRIVYYYKHTHKHTRKHTYTLSSQTHTCMHLHIHILTPTRTNTDLYIIIMQVQELLTCVRSPKVTLEVSCGVLNVSVTPVSRNLAVEQTETLI